MYTQAFVKSGVLDKDGRTAYQELPAQACPMLDRQRAVNEIALVNQETGEVTYGIESLFKVFAFSIPFLKPLFLFRPFVWLMSKIYAFIAFNRRVIIPAPVAANRFELQPTFRLDYRIAYLLVTWIITAFILSAYAEQMTELIAAGNWYREYLICGGQIFFQGAIISVIHKNKRWEYLGNMMTISFGGALLLLPVLLLAQFVNLHPLFCATWFMAVAGLMLLEHIRRSKLLELGWILTTSWVLYRILVLLFILLTNI
jgi:hypothetical protein